MAAPSPDGSRLLLIEPEPNPPVMLLGRPHLALGGVRVDPATGGLRCTSRIASFRVLPVDGRPEVPLRLPDDRSFGVPVWSPGGRWLALARHFGGGLGTGKELWTVDAASGEARAVPGLGVTDTLSGPSWTPDTVALPGQPLPMLRWAPDGRLLAAAVPSGRPPLARAAMPEGPYVEDTNGKRSQAQTFQGLLASAEDDRLFQLAATSQLVRVDPASGAVERIGEPGLLYRFEPSPDGRWLLVERLQPPFSHRVPWSDFACRSEVWDAASGRPVALVADRPVADEVPRHGVPTGARGVRWLANRDATLTWIEALDGGDPTVEAPHRERLLRWDAPFREAPEEALRMRHRIVDRRWLAAPERLLLTELDIDRRWRTTWFVDLADPDARRVLFDLSVNDAYGDPGAPLMALRPSGHTVVRQDGDAIYLTGAGASREGARPFLDRYDLATGQTQRLFQSAADAYERFVCFAGGARDRIVIERESPTEPANLHVVSGSGDRRPLTPRPDPHPELGATTRLIRYRRDDGVPLSGLLALPPGWCPGGPPLPLLLWAYPLDYSDPATAGQVRGSERTFTRVEGASPLWLLFRGWAVVYASMPVIGDPETMNDTFVDQVVASARAAVDELAESGVVDRRRVVVGGHSYGGLMTATLLAHSDLFAAGIARSGAYNRTLTPFGFQTERRSYWEAPDVYHRVSPFSHADRIRAPLLLIHGAADNNPGTFPIQSERLFQAIQGHGGTARLVVLPFEDHSYLSRESVLHVIAEMLDWTERHAPARE
ncbi:MAG TPA: prolyl oligopeptidase family serine peptidase [Candidatus Dormibacteraeota bacterium]